MPFKVEIDVDLYNLLPEFFKRIEEYKALTETEDIEFRKLYGFAVQVLCDLFVQTCSEARLTLWENALGIESDGTESATYRRFRILAYMARGIPYTTPKMKELLNTSLGVGAWSLLIDNSVYSLEVIANSQAPPDAVKIIGSLFIDVVPAHYDTLISIDTSKMLLYRGLIGSYYVREQTDTPQLPEIRNDTSIYTGVFLNSAFGRIDLGVPKMPTIPVMFRGLTLTTYGNIILP
ncbi:MAG: YmfQ family protein [Oscillospiraceae bacterium]|jgi:hypothetical protein|nr:YmfQ family protein [Oscillospiraceae bacterium]